MYRNRIRRFLSHSLHKIDYTLGINLVIWGIDVAKSKKSKKPLEKGKKLTIEQKELYEAAKAACEDAMHSDEAQEYYQTLQIAKQQSDYLYKRAQLEKIPAKLRIKAMEAIAAVVKKELGASEQLDNISDKIKPYDSKFFYYAKRVVAFLLIAAAVAVIIYTFWPVILAGLSIALAGFLAASTWTAVVAGLSSAMTFIGGMMTGMPAMIGIAAPVASATTNLIVGSVATAASPFIGYAAYKAVAAFRGKNKTPKEEADYTTKDEVGDEDDDEDGLEMGGMGGPP